MKKFTKLFLSCAAIAALTATVAVSAMAEGEGVPVNMTGETPTTATYVEETGKITFAAPSDMDAEKAATFIVLPSAAELEAGNLVGIDQTEKGVGFDKNGLKDVKAEDKVSYTVKLGYYNTNGDFKILTGTLFSQGSPIVLGDVTGEGEIKANDATAILWAAAKSKDPAKTKNAGKTITLADGTTKVAGDVTGEGEIKANDATAVLWAAAKSKDPAKIKDAGTTVTGTMAE